MGTMIIVGLVLAWMLLSTIIIIGVRNGDLPRELARI